VPPVRRLPFANLGIVGQGLRFALTGGLVALVYAVTTIVLADVAGVPFQVALATGFTVGLAVHFTLQRVFVWADHDAFALSLHQHVGRYLLVAAAQYGVTAASSAVLPGALGIATEVVYLVTVATIVLTNFLLFRHHIFRGAGRADVESPDAAGDEREGSGHTAEAEPRPSM
jgi:putative flippase GtrA